MKKKAYKTDSRLLFFMAFALARMREEELRRLSAPSKETLEAFVKKAGKVIFDAGGERYYLPAESYAPVLLSFDKALASGVLAPADCSEPLAKNLMEHGHFEFAAVKKFSAFFEAGELRSAVDKEKDRKSVV